MASIRRVFAASCFLLAFGCAGPASPLIPVEGKITVRREPLTNGLVVFRPNREKGNTDKREARANIEPEGSGRYKLTCEGKDGSPVGWYRVSVYGIKPGTTPPEWLADEKYADPRKSGLTVEVRAGAPAGSYDFDLDPPK